MIFRPELAKLIKQGKKTQTRRIPTSKTCRYETGKSYAVQPGRGQTAICRITVNHVRTETLGDITLKDVRREGFTTTEEFFDYWQTLHGHVDPAQPVWVLTFDLGDRTDTPRLLAARPGAPHGDYVTSAHLAMDNEGEGLSEEDLDRYATFAHARDEKRRPNVAAIHEPLIESRDTIARELERMRSHLSRQPNDALRQTVRRLERELAVLDRKLVA